MQQNRRIVLFSLSDSPLCGNFVIFFENSMINRMLDDAVCTSHAFWKGAEIVFWLILKCLHFKLNSDISSIAKMDYSISSVLKQKAVPTYCHNFCFSFRKSNVKIKKVMCVVFCVVCTIFYVHQSITYILLL